VISASDPRQGDLLVADPLEPLAVITRQIAALQAVDTGLPGWRGVPFVLAALHKRALALAGAQAA
jgi:hypothetical protein